MKKPNKKLIGIAYVRLVQDEQGEVNFEYELAMPELKPQLNVPNKWLALIQLADKSI